MTLLLTLFLLIYQAGDLQAVKSSAVDFSAVKQGPVKNQSCFDFHYRLITFRVKNRSDKPIYIPGRNYKPGRHPFGYLIKFDVEKDQWLHPEGSTSHRPYQEFAAHAQKFYELDVYVLAPGKSMTFETLAVKTDLGHKLKQGIFISFGQNEEPRMVTSEEFTLR